MSVDQAFTERLLEVIQTYSKKPHQVDILIFLNRRDPDGQKKPPRIDIREHGVGG